MTDTPNDPLDRDIRNAVAEVVNAAPPPIPYDRLAAQTVGTVPAERRWWTAAAAVVIVVAGVAAISLVASTRSDRTTDASTPPASSASPSSPPGTTVETTTPSTRPPLPDPSGFSTGPFPDIPEGSLDAGPGDLIGVTTDGNVSLYRDVLAAEPGEPVVLTSGHPRPGQVFLGLGAVAMNGSLISNLPVEFEVDGPSEVTTVSQPQSEPVPLVGGVVGAASHDGTRFLVRERQGVRYELAVYDARHDTVTRRGMAAFPSDQAGGGAFVWSQDDRELYSFTPDNGRRQAVFTRIDSATLEVIDTTVVEDWGLDGRRFASEHAYFAGMWDGDALFSTSDGEPRAYTMPGLVATEIDDPAWWISNSVTFDIAADGNTAVWIAEGTTYVQRVGEAPVAVRDDLVEVGFVDAVAADPTSPPATSTPTAAPEIPGLFPEPGDTELSTFTAIAPSGSIDAAPGDMVSVAADGDLWLHRGAFDPPQYGRTPSEPVRLVDMPDPREIFTEGEGPNTVSSVGGFVNGALIYADCCEPVSGNVYAISEPEGARFNVSPGSAAAADATGRRWAIVDPYGVHVIDYTTGVHTSLLDDATDDGSFQQLHAVTWSPDFTEIWALGYVWEGDAQTNVLIRYGADGTLEELGRRELVASDVEALNGFGVAGRLADGTVVLAEYGPDGAVLHFLGPDAAELDLQPPWSWPADASAMSISPDGSTLAYIDGGTAYLVREGQEPVEWGTDVRAVWFVTTPAMPIGTPTCDPGPDSYSAPWQFADLDGDGVSERLQIAASGESQGAVVACGGSVSFTAGVPRAEAITPIDLEGDGTTEFWVGDTADPSTCGQLWRWDDELVPMLPSSKCVGPDQFGFACVALDGVIRPVFYERKGDTLSAILYDATNLGERTYQPGELDEMHSLFDLAC